MIGQGIVPVSELLAWVRSAVLVGKVEQVLKLHDPGWAFAVVVWVLGCVPTAIEAASESPEGSVTEQKVVCRTGCY